MVDLFSFATRWLAIGGGTLIDKAEACPAPALTGP